MTMLISDIQMVAPEPVAPPFPAAEFQRKALIILALAALADWLFYGHAVGISFVLFLLALISGVLAGKYPEAAGRRTAPAFAMLIAALAPFAAAPGWIASLFAILGTALAANHLGSSAATSWSERAKDAAMLVLRCLWQAIPDTLRIARWWTQAEKITQPLRGLAMWIMPLAFAAVFVLLFASANPLIEDGLAAIDLSLLFNHLSIGRIVFWSIAILLIWPFIFLRDRKKREPQATTEVVPDESITPEIQDALTLLFGKAAILRSLVVFNLLFAVQTGLDAAYLWGGAALPADLTYAQYAHRGAYPLIVTALLAAGFVIAATWPGSEASQSRTIRTLVYLWTAQNVLLVVSSMLRLDLYVAVYSLTYWRIAAFIWMILVAVGLVLIIARIWLDRPNDWLVKMNFLSLALTLYISSFINFPYVIASYNVAHASGQAFSLDLHYLESLGPQAIPGIDRYLAGLAQLPPGSALTDAKATEIRARLAAAHRTRMQDWRAWSFYDWRLQRYLSAHRPAAPTAFGPR